MKKISLFLMAAAALGFAACQEDTTSAPAQTNPAEPTMDANCITVSLPEATATAVNLNEYNIDGEDNLIEMLTYKLEAEFPEYYAIEGEMEVYNDNTFAEPQVLDMVTVENSKLCVKMADWENAHLALYSENPREIATWVRYKIYAVNGSSRVVLSFDNNIYFDTHEVKITPLASKYVVDDSYKVVGTATTNMNPTNPDDIYNPPTFYCTLNVIQGQDYNWTVVGSSGKKLVPADPKADKGELVEGTTPGVITDYGPHQLTIDLKAMTYKIEPAISVIYAYSNAIAHSFGLETNDFAIYRGFAGLNMNKFILKDANVNADVTKVWGASQEEGAAENALELGSEATCPVKDKGLYWLVVDLPALTFEATAVEAVTMVGSFQGWNEKEGAAMTAGDKWYGTWSGEVELATGDQFKFVFNNSWDLNLGQDVPGEGAAPFAGALVEHGGTNILWDQPAGKYVITLDLTKLPYTMSWKAAN